MFDYSEFAKSSRRSAQLFFKITLSLFLIIISWSALQTYLITPLRQRSVEMISAAPTQPPELPPVVAAASLLSEEECDERVAKANELVSQFDAAWYTKVREAENKCLQICEKLRCPERELAQECQTKKTACEKTQDGFYRLWQSCETQKRAELSAAESKASEARTSASEAARAAEAAEERATTAENELEAFKLTCQHQEESASEEASGNP